MISVAQHEKVFFLRLLWNAKIKHLNYKSTEKKSPLNNGNKLKQKATNKTNIIKPNRSEDCIRKKFNAYLLKKQMGFFRSFAICNHIRFDAWEFSYVTLTPKRIVFAQMFYSLAQSVILEMLFVIILYTLSAFNESEEWQEGNRKARNISVTHHALLIYTCFWLVRFMSKMYRAKRDNKRFYCISLHHLVAEKVC